MKVVKTENGLKLYQKSDCEELLSKFGMLDCVPVKTPIKCDLLAIGGLLHLSLCTRPDIAYSVNYLSQFNNSYGKEEWSAVQRVFKFFKGTMDFGVQYTNDELDKIGYCCASFANDLCGRKYVSGYVFCCCFFLTLCNGAVSLESRKEEVTTLSSTEVGYI